MRPSSTVNTSSVSASSVSASSVSASSLDASSLDVSSGDATNLAALLHAQAASHPDQPALVEPGKPLISYLVLQKAVHLAAALLHTSGLRPGDRVLLYQPISSALY